MSIRRLIIDMLIPHHPELVEYAQRISSLHGTDGVALQVLEHDERTKTIEMTIEGEDSSFPGRHCRRGGVCYSVINCAQWVINHGEQAAGESSIAQRGH